MLDKILVTNAKASIAWCWTLVCITSEAFASRQKQRKIGVITVH